MSRVIGKNLLKNAQPPKNYDDFVIPRNDRTGNRSGILTQDISPTHVRNILHSAAKGRIDKLYELYMRMETDSRYGGLVSSLKAAVAGMPIKVQEADARTQSDKDLATEYAEVIEDNVMNLDLHNLTRAFTDAYIQGQRVFELVWDRRDLKYNKDMYVVTKVRGVPQSRLRMETDEDSDNYGQTLLVTDKYKDGAPLDSWPEGKLIHVEESDGEGYYDMIGVARKVLAWWIAKVYAAQWWVEYTEIYGEPWRFGKYPEGASSEAKGAMRSFLQDFGRQAYGLFPEGMHLQFVEANRKGTVTTYKDLIQFANNEITIALLGQMDTTGDQRQGSYARAEVLNGVRFEILFNIAQIVAKGFKQIVRHILRVNYGEDYRMDLAPSVIPLVVNTQDGETKVNTYNAMQTNGVPVPMEHFYEQTGVPKPKQGQEVIVNGQLIKYGEDEIPNPMEQQSGLPTRSGQGGSAGRQGESGQDGGSNDGADD